VVGVIPASRIAVLHRFRGLTPRHRPLSLTARPGDHHARPPCRTAHL